MPELGRKPEAEGCELKSSIRYRAGYQRFVELHRNAILHMSFTGSRATGAQQSILTDR